MEINRLEDVIGAIAKEDIVEGRFGLLVDNSTSKNFGSESDLPGMLKPATTEEAKRARFCVAFPVSNLPTPYYAFPHPTRTYSMRQGGWDQAQDTPWATTVYLTYPGNLASPGTIPSGNQCLGISEGTVTITSGNFVDSAGIRTKGSLVIVANTADDGASDAGKPKYSASNAVGVIGEVERFDSTEYSVTIKLF